MVFVGNDVRNVGYTILRWIGMQGLMDSQSPVRHPAKRRRRLLTVIQKLIRLGARYVRHGRSRVIKLNCDASTFQAFQKVYHALCDST